MRSLPPFSTTFVFEPPTFRNGAVVLFVGSTQNTVLAAYDDDNIVLRTLSHSIRNRGQLVPSIMLMCSRCLTPVLRTQYGLHLPVLFIMS